MSATRTIRGHGSSGNGTFPSRLRLSLSLLSSFLVGLALFASSAVHATPIALQNGTATFSQFGHSPDLSIDGNLSGSNAGWAIYDGTGITAAQTVVWETAADVDAAVLDVSLVQNFLCCGNPAPNHLIGRFRISVTSDDRATFADGLDSGGDVTANWIVLTDPIFSGPAGVTFTVLGDASILVGGAVPSVGSYGVQHSGNFFGLTGIRLEVLEDPSLPTNGPGLYPNGNFVLTELQLDSSGTPIPEPSTALLVALGLIGLGFRHGGHPRD